MHRVKVDPPTNAVMREMVELNGKVRQLAAGVTVKECFHNESFGMIFRNETEDMDMMLRVEFALHNFKIRGQGPEARELVLSIEAGETSF